jgi:hypothetical protein
MHHLAHPRVGLPDEAPEEEEGAAHVEGTPPAARYVRSASNTSKTSTTRTSNGFDATFRTEPR